MGTQHSTQNGTDDSKASLSVVSHVSDQRMKVAAARAVEAYAAVRRKAARLCEEMDEVTPSQGIPTTGLSEEDSVVTSVAEVIAAHQQKK